MSHNRQTMLNKTVIIILQNYGFHIYATEPLVVYTDATLNQGGVVIPRWDLSQSFDIPQLSSINATEVFAALTGHDRVFDLLLQFNLHNVAISMHVDSQVALYSLRKGQGVVFHLNPMLITMYMTILIKYDQSHSVTWVWVPTAANPADEPSRAVR
jgi:hypothetical protein